MNEQGAATDATIVSVGRAAEYGFSKPIHDSIRLVEGLGVESDAHAGETVQHQWLKQRDPDKPNLRQVHLLSEELIEELNADGFNLKPGDLGENVTTRGLDLINLPRGTRLQLGADTVLEVTGLRFPCSKMDDLRPGLFKAVIDEDENGNQILKPGVMTVVVTGGEVHAGDAIDVQLPPEPHEALKPV